MLYQTLCHNEAYYKEDLMYICPSQEILKNAEESENLARSKKRVE